MSFEYQVVQKNQLLRANGYTVNETAMFQSFGSIYVGDKGYLVSYGSATINAGNIVLANVKVAMPPLVLENDSTQTVASRNVVVTIPELIFTPGQKTLYFRMLPNDKLAEGEVVIGNQIRQFYDTVGVAHPYTRVIYDQENGDIPVDIGTFAINGTTVEFTPSTTDFPVVPFSMPTDDLSVYLTKSANLSDVANKVTAFNNIKQQATEADSGVAKIATQELAEAGEDDVTIMTPLKTKQAISAQPIPDATETVKGILALATDAEALAGSNETKAIVPSSLAHVLNQADYASDTQGWKKIGDFIIQWGATEVSAVTQVTFPIVFPNKAFIGLATIHDTSSGGAEGKRSIDIRNLNVAGMTVTSGEGGGGIQGWAKYWLAIGY